MKIDLCKLFGVEEGEVFRFKIINDYYNNNKYRIHEGELQYNSLIKDNDYWAESLIECNEIRDCEIIKLPKRKEFTDDELCILRNVDKESKWIARDESNNLYVYKNKPIKFSGYWDTEYGDRQRLKMFSHLFQSIQWEDEEPVCIDDYVER